MAAIEFKTSDQDLGTDGRQVRSVLDNVGAGHTRTRTRSHAGSQRRADGWDTVLLARYLRTVLVLLVFRQQLPIRWDPDGEGRSCTTPETWSAYTGTSDVHSNIPK